MMSSAVKAAKGLATSAFELVYPNGPQRHRQTYVRPDEDVAITPGSSVAGISRDSSVKIGRRSSSR